MKKAWSSVEDEEYKKRVREILMQGVKDALKSNHVLNSDDEDENDIDISSTQLDDLPPVRVVPSNKRTVTEHGKSSFANPFELMDL